MIKEGLERDERERKKRERQEWLASPEGQRWQKSAEQGDANAQYELGLLYIDGEGVSQDHAKASEWIRKAAEQGHMAAKDFVVKEKLEQARREAKSRKIILGKTFAMIIQIGVIGVFIFAITQTTGYTVPLVIASAVEAAFFCGIFFSGWGEGFKSMILIIVWSVLLGVSFIFAITNTSDNEAFFLLLVPIGYIVSAILAYRCK
jgi:Fe2+ transport system protein B